jgi:hypothetical protein
MYQDLDIHIHLSVTSKGHNKSSPGRFYSLASRNKALESTSHKSNSTHLMEPNSKVHYNIYKNPQLEPILRQLYPIHTFTHYKLAILIFSAHLVDDWPLSACGKSPIEVLFCRSQLALIYLVAR